MIEKYFPVVLIFLCQILPTPAQSINSFGKFIDIEPLVSSRIEVHRQFGLPKVGSNPYFDVFELDGATITFEYSRGFCASNSISVWNVDPFIVTRGFFEFDKPLPLKRLKIDTQMFQKRRSSDVKGAYQLESDAEGIYIGISPKRLVEIVERIPRSTKNHLMCSRVGE